MKKVHGSNLPCFFFEHQNIFLDTLQVPRTWMILSRAVQTSLETIGSSFFFGKAHTLPVPPYQPAQPVVLEDASIVIDMRLTFGIVHLDLELGSFHVCLGKNNESPRGFQKIFSARRTFIMCKFSGMNRRRPH